MRTLAVRVSGKASLTGCEGQVTTIVWVVTIISSILAPAPTLKTSPLTFRPQGVRPCSPRPIPTKAVSGLWPLIVENLPVVPKDQVCWAPCGPSPLPFSWLCRTWRCVRLSLGLTPLSLLQAKPVPLPGLGWADGASGWGPLLHQHAALTTEPQGRTQTSTPGTHPAMPRGQLLPGSYAHLLFLFEV